MKTQESLQPLPFVNPTLPSENDEGGLHVGQVIATLRRRLLLIVGVASAITLAAGLKAFTDTPVYDAKFEILVQPDSAESQVISSLDETGNRPTSRQAVTPDGVKADLLQILASPKILEPVVQKLQNESPNICSELLNPGAEDPVIDPSLSEAEVRRRCYEAMVNNLAITTLAEESNIVQVSFRGNNEESVVKVLDLISEAYLAYSLESRQADIQRGIKFVENKLPDLRDRVSVLQDQLQQLRQRYVLIDPESKGNELSNQISAFSQEQLQAQVELEQSRTLSSDLQGQLSQLPTELAASSALSENPRYQNLIAQLLALDGEIAQASTIYLETAPEMEVLLEQRRNILSLLTRESQVAQRQVGGQVRQLEVRDRALQQTLGSLRADVNELALVSRIYTDIQRELQIATDNLNQFLAKRQLLEIDAAQREIPWELLTPTTEPEPTSASLPQNLVLGAILGLLVGIGAALLAERMTDVVQTPEELKRITGFPILGAIPNNDSLLGASGINSFAVSLQRLDSAIQQNQQNQDINRARYKDIDAFSEAFRSLYANIRLLNSDSPIQSLVISSTQPGEGKTTTAIHLAMAASAMTQRVLLVETDLRRPRLYQYLGLHHSGGLIDVISGDLSVKEAIQRSTFEPNMFVLTAGAIPPDPTRVLSSQKMQRLMEQFQNSFDLVIYDAPPLVNFADAYLIGAHTNGMILVSEVGKLRRSALEQGLDRVQVAKTPVLGIVLQRTMS
ncbi:GumC family protein [Thermocoleostomius sinensis]|uniref:non-specific protein-tyrosine kinase n=1 Tax=Thermocoleostomius sinensis A174 TaxID=2016057 RepID=A0A9E8ZG16_9CYAN|nr:polysaccharide biosynthesis tyrosine autokinase [Thermocoleostomius sinensis]WAL62377.1 polysaccharide biosynthesis tyrosine autokinase [Thermocoleostomius sinensis A174]